MPLSPARNELREFPFKLSFHVQHPAACAPATQTSTSHSPSLTDIQECLVALLQTLERFNPGEGLTKFLLGQQLIRESFQSGEYTDVSV
jgi:hypothetical protein